MWYICMLESKFKQCHEKPTFTKTSSVFFPHNQKQILKEDSYLLIIRKPWNMLAVLILSYYDTF